MAQVAALSSLLVRICANRMGAHTTPATGQAARCSLNFEANQLGLHPDAFSLVEIS
jgi:hypothetical protein